MIVGNPMDAVVIVESEDSYSFQNEVNSILLQDSQFDVANTYVDAHKFKAIIIRRTTPEYSGT